MLLFIYSYQLKKVEKHKRTYRFLDKFKKFCLIVIPAVYENFQITEKVLATSNRLILDYKFSWILKLKKDFILYIYSNENFVSTLLFKNLISFSIILLPQELHYVYFNVKTQTKKF